jgi:chromate reductase, NAD(P)H dehydrogenase (quinone)
MRLLAISGSLRARSSNTAALKAAAIVAPSHVKIVLYTGLGQLPHFNPDLDTGQPPEAVAAFRWEIGRCDGLIICSPEYAHGVAGSMKNAFDWLVSSLEFPGKPVALFNTSPRATHAQAHLRETLRTMSARLVEEACIALPLLGRDLDHTGIAADSVLAGQIRVAITTFAQAIARK